MGRIHSSVPGPDRSRALRHDTDESPSEVGERTGVISTCAGDDDTGVSPPGVPVVLVVEQRRKNRRRGTPVNRPVEGSLPIMSSCVGSAPAVGAVEHDARQLVFPWWRPTRNSCSPSKPSALLRASPVVGPFVVPPSARSSSRAGVASTRKTSASRSRSRSERGEDKARARTRSRSSRSPAKHSKRCASSRTDGTAARPAYSWWLVTFEWRGKGKPTKKTGRIYAATAAEAIAEGNARAFGTCYWPIAAKPAGDS